MSSKITQGCLTPDDDFITWDEPWKEKGQP